MAQPQVWYRLRENGQQTAGQRGATQQHGEPVAEHRSQGQNDRTDFRQAQYPQHDASERDQHARTCCHFGPRLRHVLTGPVTLEPRGVRHLQNIHPLVVHFPVAFLAGAALIYILAWCVGHDTWAWTGLWLLVLGTLSGAIAVGTGLYAEPGVMVARSVRTALLVPHKRVMLGTLGLSAAVTVWAALARPFPARGRRLFIVLLFVLFAGLTTGADYGARMVYDYNAGGDACGQPIDFTK